MAARGKHAARALSQLAGDAPFDAIADFVSRFGPLTNFELWVAETPAIEEQVDFLWARIIATNRYDFADFIEWCEEHGEREARDYSLWVLGQWRTKPGLISPPLPEPAAFYRWAAQNLARLESESNRGALSETAERWLAARLNDVRLRLTVHGRLVVNVMSLLAYLAVLKALRVSEFNREVKDCIGCAAVFVPVHGRQKYCDAHCEDRSRKRRLRARISFTRGP